MNQFRFGIIGAGKIGNKFCDAVKRVEGAEVVSVSSKDRDRAKAFAEKNRIPNYYDSYDEMLSRDDIDAVYIATTHNFHYENLLACISHGKHALCEKSMVLTAEQARTVFGLAATHDVFVMEAMWSRFLPSIRKARRWVSEGKIGTVSVASAAIGWPAEYNPDGRMFNPDLAGGALYDLGVYAVELTSWLVGKPVLSASSKLLFADTGVDKADVITLVFDDCLASLQCSICSKMNEKACLYGSKGYIELPTFHYGREYSLYDENSRLVEEFKDTTENGFVYEIEEVIRCIRAGKLESDVVPHRDTIRCAEILEQCLRENRNK